MGAIGRGFAAKVEKAVERSYHVPPYFPRRAASARATEGGAAGLGAWPTDPRFAPPDPPLRLLVGSAYGMKKAAEYREHAEQCRALAHRFAAAEHREALLKMADT